MEDITDLNTDLRETTYDDILEDLGSEDYGKKMTDELENAVQRVMDLNYQEFSSEEGAEAIQEAVKAAEDAPDASYSDDVTRIIRTRALLTEFYGDSLNEFDLGEVPEGAYELDDTEGFSINFEPDDFSPN